MKPPVVERLRVTGAFIIPEDPKPSWWVRLWKWIVG